MPTWDYQDKRVLTAKDIAEAIRFRKDRNGFAKAMRQVQHWTTNGLLQTITPLETGRGVAREYVDVPTIFIAAVLQELTLFGLTLDSLKPIAEKLYYDYDDGDPFWAHFAVETREFDSFLKVLLGVDERGRLSIQEVDVWSDHPDFEPFDIRMPETSGSILLNLLAIAERIEWPVGEAEEVGTEKRGARK